MGANNQGIVKLAMSVKVSLACDASELTYKEIKLMKQESKHNLPLF